MKLNLPLAFLFFFVASGLSLAQTFQTIGSGDWNSPGIWTASNGCSGSYTSPPPTAGYYPYCAIDIVISHTVTFSGYSEFGAGYFRSITVKEGGTLKFDKDFVLSTGGSEYPLAITVENGGKIEVLNGSFKFQRNALVDIQSGGTLAVNTLEGGGGNGGTLQIKPGGLFSSSNLINLNNGLRLKVEGVLNANKLVSQGGGNEIQVFGGGNFATSGNVDINGFPFYASEKSRVSFGGDLSVTNSGDSRLYIKGESEVEVIGKTTIANLFQVGDDARVALHHDVDITGSGAALLEVKGSGDLLITGNLQKPKYSGGITVNDSGQLVVCGGSGGESSLYPPTSDSYMNISPSPAFYGGCRIMPVEFVSFHAAFEGHGRKSTLSWSTAKEWQNSHFEIERAVGDISVWKKIGEVKGNGFSDSPTDYTYTDDQLPTVGGRIFYRLKQVNFDEKFSYSSTQAIQATQLAGSLNWVAYPNPTTGSDFQLEFKKQTLLDNGPILIMLSSVQGKQELFHGHSIEEINAPLRTALSQKIPGIYLIKVVWGKNSETLKIIKK